MIVVMKKIKYLFLILVAMCTATSCSEDDLSPDSIFDTTAPQRMSLITGFLRTIQLHIISI